jgi:hypothetical protein
VRESEDGRERERERERERPAQTHTLMIIDRKQEGEE